jgi:YHS domain-containing protein
MKNLLFLFLFQAVSSYTLFAQTAVQRESSYNLSKSGVALSGYDPVSYFTKSKPSKGLASISVKYQGVTYYFTTEGNKTLFLALPQKYEPQYGGWCAYALGETNELVEVDPGTYKILNGKLYLFYNAYFNNTLPKWNANETVLKQKADKNWPAHIKK